MCGLSLVGFEEILHCVQNDNTGQSLAVCHAERGAVREFREFREFREIREFRKGSPQSP